MKLPFLNTNNSTSSNSSSTNSTSWSCSSCNQNPKTISFRATNTFTNHQEDNELEDPLENLIKELRSSKRLIFETKGETNSILEEATSKQEEQELEQEEKGFVLLSLESNDPYSDFKTSMEDMVEAYSLHHDLESLQKLLLQFLKVNDRSNHRYIFSAFIDLLVNLELHTKDPIDGGVSVSRAATTPSSPLSFSASCSSSSSSDETCSTSVGLLPLSSLLEMDEKTLDS